MQREVAAREHEAVVVERDRAVQPLGVGAAADEHEDRRRRHGLDAAVRLQHELLQALAAVGVDDARP